MAVILLHLNARPARDSAGQGRADSALRNQPNESTRVQRSDQQSAKESARGLSTLPHAARSAAPFGAALDYLPPALGSWRSLPRPVPGIDRRGAVTLACPPISASVTAVFDRILTSASTRAPAAGPRRSERASSWWPPHRGF